MAAGWVAAAVLATATGVAGIAVIGRGLSGPTGELMSAEDIERALATAPTPASATPSAQPSATPAGEKLYQSPGGVVIARCDGDIAVITSWTPANGYRFREVDNERGREAEVSFERDEQRVDVEVTCPAGQPVFTLDTD